MRGSAVSASDDSSFKALALAYEKDAEILNKIQTEIGVIQSAVSETRQTNATTAQAGPIRNKFRLLVTQVTRNGAVNLGFPAIASGSVSSDELYFYALYAAYSEIEATNDAPKQYLGYGVRFIIRTKSQGGEVKVDLPYLAAHATLTATDSSFQFDVFGLSDKNAIKLTKELNSFTKFDVSTYGGLLGVQRSIIEMVEAGTLEVEPSLFPMPETTNVATAMTRLAYTFGVRSIAAGKTINEATAALPPESDEYKEQIALAYKEIADIASKNKKPTRDNVRAAQVLLVRFP